MSTRRPVSAARAPVAGPLALVFVLAGCSSLPLSGPAAGSSTAKAGAPAVGQCWNATVSHADEWSAWDGGAATSCSASHVLYTYNVGTISGDTAATWASTA